MAKIRNILEEFMKKFTSTEDTGVRGVVEFKVFDANGNIKDVRTYQNMIMNDGKAQIVKLMGGLNTTAFTYIAIGDDDGTTLPLATANTTLGNEIARKAATVSTATTSVQDDTLVLQTTFSSADGLSGSASIKESGVFNASVRGIMLNRKTFAPINLNWDNGDSIQITWKIQVQ